MRPTQAGFLSDGLVIASARAGGRLHNHRFIGGGRERGSGNLSGGDKPSGTRAGFLRLGDCPGWSGLVRLPEGCLNMSDDFALCETAGLKGSAAVSAEYVYSGPELPHGAAS